MATTEDKFAEMARTLCKMGITISEAIEGIQRLNQAINSQLRPVSNAKIEIPNPKGDLEIFEQIVVSRIEPVNELPEWYLEIL